MLQRVLMTLQRYLHPRGAVSFWHTPIGPVLYNYQQLDDYYIDLRAKTEYAGPYDENGIPVLNYFGSIGCQYNPCAISQWGLGAYQRLRQGEVGAEPVVLKATIWLRENLEVDDKERGFWWYKFDFDAYGLKAPWGSALAQAQGISLLLRAYCLWSDPKDLDLAKLACSALLSPVSEGGLMLNYDGYTVLEEVVADRPTAILDGMMFAIFGLFDYCYMIDDEYAKKVLAACVESLEKLLPDYDLGYWSRADLYSLDPPMPASSFYHGLHIAQLKVFADLTGRPIFNDYCLRWDRAANMPINRLRAFLNKAYFKLRYY